MPTWSTSCPDYAPDAGDPAASLLVDNPSRLFGFRRMSAPADALGLHPASCAPHGPGIRQLWPYVMIGDADRCHRSAISHPPRGPRCSRWVTAFIKLIRMLIAPIIFCTVVHGIAAMGDMAKVGRVAVKALVYFEVDHHDRTGHRRSWAVNLSHPGVGMNVDLASSLDTAAVRDVAAKSQGDLGVVPFLIEHHPARR